ncbi:hypothetical protein [Puia dinghuensis]|uniref:Uncharacterized protein n=1 Tax=Puia dinghuensis TaxID=1792502 RepID=A0A8J2UEY7_9BACT|nr:hypothetical protein [Puia dinghuensis]GGB06340.1 hypothetical protein GCM10011511_32190 [Puia dinghuensis]
MENQPKQPVSGEEKEVDLGLLFTVFTKVMHSIGAGLRSFFNWLFEGVILFLLFLKRRILLVLVGLLLSLVPGLYNYMTKGNQYYSTMTVRANFGSAPELYNKIDYFNSLIKLGDTKKLADIFHLSEPEAGKLRTFAIDPVDDELQAAELYKSTFFDLDRSFESPSTEAGAMLRDTSWQKLIKYADFKKKLKNTDFPLQTITLYSLSPDVFTHVSAGLIETVTSTPSLLARRQAEDSLVQEQANLILGSLSNADTLMKAYNRKIGSGDRGADVSTLAISTQPTHSPVVELFDKEKDLRRSLTNTRQHVEEHRDILQVYSDFNAVGTPIAPFRESFLQYSVWCLLGTIVLLLLFEGYLKLGELEKRRSTAKGI